MRCATCGHLDTTHQHFRPGSDCGRCACIRYVHPLVGVWRAWTDRVAARLRRG